MDGTGKAVAHPEQHAADVIRRFVDVGSRRISYLAAGDRASAPTIVLIHGSGVSARYWVHQLRALQHAFSVIAIDLPGHGQSDPIPMPSVEHYADVAADALHALGAGRTVAVGHSLGGAVAIALAARHPEMVRGLVLLSSCVKLPRVDGPWGRVLPYLPGTLRKILFFAMARKLLFAPGVADGAVSIGMEELRCCRPDTILDDLHAARSMDLTDEAAGLDVPTLVMCGSRDRLTPPELSERLRALIPTSRLSIVDGAGHMLLLEAAEDVNRAILEFADGLGARGHMRAGAVVPARGARSLVRRLLDWARRRR